MEWPYISCHLFYLVSQMYPKHSYLDAFNKVLPNMKKSIVGSVDGLCDKAISEKLVTHEEKAKILVDNNEHKQASRFLDSLAPKIEVDPEVLALLMNMLTGLHLRTCDQIVCKWFLLLGVGPGLYSISMHNYSGEANLPVGCLWRAKRAH